MARRLCPLFVRAANLTGRPRFRRLDQRDDIADLPKPIGNLGRHRRTHPKLGVNADEVVIHHVQRDRVGVVLDLLREPVRQPREPAHVHPHGEVLALGVGRRDVLRFGVALDRLLPRAGALGRAVAALGALGSGAVQLDQHRVIDIAAERALDRVEVSLVAVAGELHAVRQPLRQIIHERDGVVAVPAADKVGGDDLRIGVDRGPGPDVAIGQIQPLGASDVLLLGRDEGPDLIDLDALRRQAAHVLVVVGRARLAGIFQELGDRVLAGAGNASDRADRATLAEKVQDARAVFGRELVHALDYIDPYA